MAFICLYVWFFFFSSRRRHTRLQGDWSSDVCSSDFSCSPAASGTPRAKLTEGRNRVAKRPAADTTAPARKTRCSARSEERRVGKEGGGAGAGEGEEEKKRKRRRRTREGGGERRA